MIMASAGAYNVLFLTTKHPRKELLAKLGATHADKIYQDRLDGTTLHVGYIVNQLWWTFYTVTPWEKEVK